MDPRPAVHRNRPRRAGRGTTRLALSLVVAATGIRAQTLADAGCPVFHCTPEASGVVYQPLVGSVSVVSGIDTLGVMPSQGCSGNGTILACLFSHDAATGTASGTLKVLDATTLQPLWGSAGVANSFNLNATSAAAGQVPVIFTDGSLAAGDSGHFVLYDPAGGLLGNVALTGAKKNFGLTPISTTYGVVSQQNGVLTLIDMPNWQAAGTVTLRDPVTRGSLSLVSPSSGTAGSLYAVAQNPATGDGYLFSVKLHSRAPRLSVESVFTFRGVAGSSPVVVTPSVTGLPENLILLPVPGLPGDATPQNRLMAFLDSPGGLEPTWEVLLPAPMTVAPTIDGNSRSLFYHDNNSPVIFQNDLVTGAPLNSFNIRALGGYPLSFKLNGHLGASESGSPFTLLLAGEYTTSPGTGAQLVITFQPLASPGQLQSATTLSSVPAGYLAAWNFAPSSQAGTVCPIALTETAGKSALVRLCDF